MAQPGAAAVAPLEGLLALDLTGGLGWLRGKILADVGATVLKIDPPGGDAGRDQPPLIHGPAGSVGATWVAFNSGKQRVDLDLSVAADRARLLELAVSADFVLESEAPGPLDELGLGWGVLSKRSPSLRMTPRPAY